MKQWNNPVGSSREDLERFAKIKGAQTEQDKAKVAGKDYLGLIGCLLYAACQTRPDVQYYVCHLSQFMGNPSIEAYDAGIGVLCYLYKTRHLGITYSTEIKIPSVHYQEQGTPINPMQFTQDSGLHLYTDASFARDTDLSSVSGYVALINNGAVSWASKKIKIACQSTTEAEIVAATHGAKDVVFLRNLLSELGFPTPDSTPLFIDSSAGYGYIRHQGAKQRTKYFELWVTYVRDAHRSKAVSVHLITTTTEVADALTKPLGRGELRRFRSIMLNTDGDDGEGGDKGGEERHGNVGS